MTRAISIPCTLAAVQIQEQTMHFHLLSCWSGWPPFEQQLLAGFNSHFHRGTSMHKTPSPSTSIDTTLGLTSDVFLYSQDYKA